MIRLRTAVSRVAMLAGAVLMVVGLGLRLGFLALPGPVAGGAGPSPSAAAAVVASSGPEPASTITPAPTAASTITPSPASSDSPGAAPSAPPPTDPSPLGTTWFADEFDTVAAWPDGRLDWMTTTVRDGAYRIDAIETDLPVFVFAAAGEGAPRAPLAVAADVVIGPGDPASSAGIVLEAADGTRLVALVSGAGRVTILRDSIEQLDEVAVGFIDPPVGPVRLRLLLEGDTASVGVDGRVAARAHVTLAPIGFGLAVWARGNAAFEVLRYVVWSAP